MGSNRIANLRRRLPKSFLARLTPVVAPLLAGTWLVARAAQLSVVVPPGMEAAEHDGYAGTLGHTIRSQQVYDAGHFPTHPFVITGLRWRRDIGTPPFQATSADLTVRLSTSSRSPEGLSQTFADNLGPDETVVFHGRAAFSSPAPAGQPNPFDLTLNFTNPFPYDPVRGNLLIEIVNASGSGIRHVDASNDSSDGASRVFSYTPDAPVATWADTGADILQIDYTLGAEQPTLVVPAGFADREDDGYAGTLQHTARLQNVFGAGNFPDQPLVLQALAFRRDASTAPFDNGEIDIALRLSVTSVRPDHLSAIFAHNYGTPAQTVFRGTLAVASPSIAADDSPAAFEILIPFDRHFRYDPRDGHLLVEVLSFGGTGVGLTDASNDADDAASRAFSYDPLAEQAQYVDTGADILSFHYTSIPRNVPPWISPLADRTVDELTLLTVTATATDPDRPAQTLTFSLGDGAPEGAAIDPVTGEFSWTPTEAQGPGEYAIIVTVTDDGDPPFSANRTFTVTVHEVNTAPVLEPVADREVAPGGLLEVALEARDADLPPNTLSYLLVEGPPGATVDPGTGRFQWQPAPGLAGTVHGVVVRVEDDGDPPLAAEAGFSVRVTGADMAWEVVSQVTDVGLNAVAWGGDRFVAVGGLGRILTSPDGAVWTERESGTEESLMGVAYGAGRFVAAGAAGALLTSADGIAWEVMEPMVAPWINLMDVAHGHGRFVVVGFGGTILTSETGEGDWTKRDLAASLNLWSVHFANDRFVTARADGQVAISGDGLTWELEDLETGAFLSAVGHGHGSWWVAGVERTPPFSPGAAVLFRSTDGAEWVAADAWPDDRAISGFGFGHGRLVAVGVEGVGPEAGGVWITRDGSEWLRALTGPIPALEDATFNGDGWVAVGALGTIVRSTRLLPPWALEIDIVGLGEVEPTPDGPLYEDSATVTVLARPAEGWEFAGWSGDLTGTTNPAQVDLNANRRVQAVFRPDNLPPVLAPIADQMVDELTLLTFTVSATDPDEPADTLRFALINAPPGATINAVTGVFSWTPTEAQGPGEYAIIVTVTDDGTPPLGDQQTFTVTVNEVNQAPVLAAIPDHTLAGRQSLAFTAVATDPDLPPNRLGFHLEEAPAGATLDPDTGAFYWRPGAAHTPGSHRVTIVVTDDGNPPLSDRRSFAIAVVGPDPAAVILPGASGPTSNGFQITFMTVDGWDYRVEASDDLETWTPLGVVHMGTGGSTFVVDPAALDRPHRFYRVRVIE